MDSVIQSQSHHEIPMINVSQQGCNRGTEEWRHLCERVRDACETYGCFEVVYDDLSMDLRSETFALIKQLFNLPPETKQKNFNPKPFHGYGRDAPTLPLYESFGFEDASNYDSLKHLIEPLWPQGNKDFCETVSSMVKQLDELRRIMETLILDGYGIGENLDSIMECRTLLRVMKYEAPPAGDCMEGLMGHTDKLLCTLLCEDNVSGLELETKDGQWIKLSLSPKSFIFLVGDPLLAWSNGRLHPVKHKVTMRGDKERYSMAAFAVPVEGTNIRPPEELFDKKRPRILKDFGFWDFTRFAHSQHGIMESGMLKTRKGSNTQELIHLLLLSCVPSHIVISSLSIPATLSVNKLGEFRQITVITYTATTFHSFCTPL